MMHYMQCTMFQARASAECACMTHKVKMSILALFGKNGWPCYALYTVAKFTRFVLLPTPID